MLRSLRLLPLTIFPLLAYNLLAFTLAGTDAGPWFTAPRFNIPLPLGGTVWAVSVGDMLLFATLGVLFLELLKSTSTATTVMIDHMLATVVFIVCMIEFLVVYRCGNSVFFAILIAALIDVVAGFSISMRVASRSIGVGSN
jgi:hypothetical protein